MLRIKVARSAAEMEGLCAAWNSLWNPRLTLFQSFCWNLHAARIFSGREEPYVIFAESDSGAAIVPATIQVEQRQIGLLGESLFDYRDYLAEGDVSVLCAAWRKLLEPGLPLEVISVRRAEAPVWRELPKQPYYGAPFMTAFSVTPEEFAAAHSRKGSRLRRLFRNGVEFKKRSGKDERLVRQVYAAKAAQGGAGNLFKDPLRVDFMRVIAQGEGQRCEIFTFEKDQNVVAALVTFRDGRCRRFYTTYYDHAWARYSPGVELLFEVTRRSLAEGLDLDFMTGEQSYKMRIATAVAPLYKVKASLEQLQKANFAILMAERAA